MPTNAKRLIILWCVGLIVGTVIIGVTSPLFVRSYLPQQFDSVRNRYVPEPGRRYRWRSEGYATTLIGDHGMPGRQHVPQKTEGMIRVALWGDSQAEGVCVADDEKLFAQIEQQSGQTIQVLPFARSGEDASHWLTQIPSVERQLSIDVHVMVVVDLPDLLAADRAPVDFGVATDETESRSKIASQVPAFVIQAFRYLVRNADETPRQLRFRVGPHTQRQPTASISEDVDWNDVWSRAMNTVRQTSERRIVIVYAPKSPTISHGKIELHEPWNESFQAMERAAIKAGMVVVDTSDVLGDVAREGRWPHGFNNGQIGSGHLNATGYRVIARELVGAIRALGGRKD